MFVQKNIHTADPPAKAIILHRPTNQSEPFSSAGMRKRGRKANTHHTSHHTTHNTAPIQTLSQQVETTKPIATFVCSPTLHRGITCEQLHPHIRRVDPAARVAIRSRGGRRAANRISVHAAPNPFQRRALPTLPKLPFSFGKCSRAFLDRVGPRWAGGWVRCVVEHHNMFAAQSEGWVGR